MFKITLPLMYTINLTFYLILYFLIMKRILVPTDFSKHAEYALRVAAQIAKKNNSKIYLLHMLELPHQGSDAVSSGSAIPQIMYFKEMAINKLETLMDADFLEGINVLWKLAKKTVLI